MVVAGEMDARHNVGKTRMLFRMRQKDTEGGEKTKDVQIDGNESTHVESPYGQGCFRLLARFGSGAVISIRPFTSRSTTSTPCMNEWS